jgi:hypothetical protein
VSELQLASQLVSLPCHMAVTIGLPRFPSLSLEGGPRQLNQSSFPQTLLNPLTPPSSLLPLTHLHLIAHSSLSPPSTLLITSLPFTSFASSLFSSSSLSSVLFFFSSALLQILPVCLVRLHSSLLLSLLLLTLIL